MGGKTLYRRENDLIFFQISPIVLLLLDFVKEFVEVPQSIIMMRTLFLDIQKEASKDNLASRWLSTSSKVSSAAIV